MDLNELAIQLEIRKKKNPNALDFKDLLYLLNPGKNIYTDTPGMPRAAANHYEDNFNLINGGLEEDSNIMYGGLNGLFKMDPELWKRMKQRMLDRTLNQDVNEWRDVKAQKIKM